MTDHHREYHEVYDQDFQPAKGESSGWIQWKGTDVCMDITCACGASYHHDGDFFYYVRCPGCQRAFAVGQTVKLIPLTPEQEARVERESTIDDPSNP